MPGDVPNYLFYFLSFMQLVSLTISQLLCPRTIPKIPGAPLASMPILRQTAEPCMLDAVGGGATGSMDIELTDNSASVGDFDHLIMVSPLLE